MSHPHVMAQSRAIPVDLDRAFRRTLVIPLPTLFRHWYGPIGPIKAVLGQEGEWGIAGQTRTVTLAGGVATALRCQRRTRVLLRPAGCAPKSSAAAKICPDRISLPLPAIRSTPMPGKPSSIPCRVG